MRNNPLTNKEREKRATNYATFFSMIVAIALVVAMYYDGAFKNTIGSIYATALSALAGTTTFVAIKFNPGKRKN